MPPSPRTPLPGRRRVLPGLCQPGGRRGEQAVGAVPRQGRTARHARHRLLQGPGAPPCLGAACLLASLPGWLVSLRACLLALPCGSLPCTADPTALALLMSPLPRPRPFPPAAGAHGDVAHGGAGAGVPDQQRGAQPVAEVRRGGRRPAAAAAAAVRSSARSLHPSVGRLCKEQCRSVRLHPDFAACRQQGRRKTMQRRRRCGSRCVADQPGVPARLIGLFACPAWQLASR